MISYNIGFLGWLNKIRTGGQKPLVKSFFLQVFRDIVNAFIPFHIFLLFTMVLILNIQYILIYQIPAIINFLFISVLVFNFLSKVS